MRSVADNAAGTPRVRDMGLSGRGLRKPKIEKDYMILVGQLQVLGFDIAVDDRRFMRVQIRKCVQQLVGPEHYPAYRERLACALEPLGKIVTRDVFHHEVLLFAFTEMIAHLWEHRVSHPRERPSFPFERIAEHLVARKIRPLQGNCTSESLVNGQINFTHTALPDQMDHKITVLDKRIL